MADLERDGLSGAHTVSGGAPSCAPSPGLPVCHLRRSPWAVQRQTRHLLSMEATFRNMPRLPLLGQVPHRPGDASVPCRSPTPSTGPLWALGKHLGGERGGRGGCFNASYHIRTPTPRQTCPFPLLSASRHGEGEATQGRSRSVPPGNSGTETKERPAPKSGSPGASQASRGGRPGRRARGTRRGRAAPKAASPPGP